MAGALKTRGERARGSPERGGQMVLLVIATGLCAILAPIGAVGALFSPLVFDERGNLLNPLAWLGFLLMVSFWIVCIIAPFIAWVLWTRKQARGAWTAIAAPAVWILATVTILQFIPG
ncbi:hypothetical protein QO010_001571 [Caulobacter ginsengisoli]|uniref:Uncharacterized protein n=1 Tax=Caulobacter ginsengisoli TaxID=400775 RepID=A0ABU0IQX0_9CAUL|nr:hypothetical protein [Caulobacter ginsengisoli]MDQ0463800.1 hypothetical protein [Caulobacter ginsengisoli]